MQEKILIKSSPNNAIMELFIFFVIGILGGSLFYIIDASMYEQPIKLFMLISVAFLFAVCGIILGGILYLLFGRNELTVTDKRVYGKAMFGKRVDLPVDSISATGTIAFLGCISISTSSGKISFLFIKNTDKFYEIINNLIIERQNKKNSNNTAENNPDCTEQLKKFKQLLDSGVITQEEFDAKKKQLLNL